MTSLADNAIAGKLLEAAVRLFALKGYPATSTREIVEAAGVTKPMLYYYFQSKEGLLEASLDHFLNHFHERLRGVMDESRTAYDLLVELVWAHLDFCQEHKLLARLFYALYFGPDDQKGLVDLEKYADAGHELLNESVARAVAEGLVLPDCQQELVTALHGMINIWVINALKGEVELSRDIAGRIIDHLLRGFRNQARAEL
jgi:AcrR family transcriptional regulator